MMAVDKHICVVLVIDDLEYGGAQRQVVELANNMDRSRFDVHLCTLSEYVPLGDQIKDVSDRLHIVAKKHKCDVTVPTRLARLLKSVKADIVHSYLFSADIASRLAGRLAGTPVIIGSERNARYCPKRRHVLAYKLTGSCVDLIIANSRAGAEFNSKAFGQPESKYRVVYNGVDTSRFKPRDPSAARAELGLSMSDRVIGVVASFKPQKNHAMLLRAFQRVLASCPHARLLLIGDRLYGGMNGTKNYQVEMDALIDELGIRARCTFLGNCDDVERVYPACDVTALSSLYEGTPNVLLESMACGVPVVATSVSDNPYVVQEGKTGFLIALNDTDRMAECIGMLLSNDSLRREMGKNAAKWVEEQFSVKQLARNTEAVYLEALGTARRQRAV